MSDRRLVIDLGAEGPAGDALWKAVSGLLGRFGRPPYVIVSNPARLLGNAPDGVVVVRLPAPSADDRMEVVAAALAQQGTLDQDLSERISGAFPVPLEMVPDGVALALSAAAENGRPTQPEARDWLTGFRRAAGARLPRLARRIEPAPCPSNERFSCLDTVVLPETQRGQLEELVNHVRFGRTVLDEWGYAALVDAQGVAALFSGQSGTGKTTAAHAVAAELNTDLYAIELAQIVSKYIGETEKNLDVIFDDAERAGAVLLFDEADALFGKRSAVSDAHDRYANIEVAYLLQRMQRFAGLAILTSNNADSIDPAFTRRLRFRIEFPRPSAADRLAIWEQSIPEPRRAGWLNLKRIALALDVTGGTIRQMALHAAILAAGEGDKIRFEHVLAGARSQLIRLGLYGDLAKLDAIAREPNARAA